MSQPKKKFSRREFLDQSRRAGLALAAFDTIFMSLVHSRAAYAQTSTEFKKFLHLNMRGACPRWGYDLMLNPNNQPNQFLANPTVANFYTAAGAGPYNGATYKLVEYGTSGIHVPYLLGQNVTLSGARSVKAWQLLDNMVQVRGIDVGNAAHPGANELHQVAIPGNPTISSLTADQAMPEPGNPTKNLMRAISLNPVDSSVFRSAKGYKTFPYQVAASLPAGSNNLTKLFASLRPISTAPGVSTQFLNSNKALSSKITAAMNQLDPAANYYYKNLLESSETSLKIITDDSIQTFKSLMTDWDQLFDKYRGNIQRVLDGTYAGINDRRIGIDFTDAQKIPYQYDTDDYTKNKDASGNVDLRLMLDGVNYDQLAAQFAVTEFLMTRDICPSISMVPAAFDDIALAIPQSVERQMILDQHNVGYMAAIYQNTMYHLSMSSCLLELIDVLKQQGKFNDTLIYMASEFNRAAQIDGGGSNHAAPATHVNLISGRVGQFKLVGNILKDSAGVGSEFGAGYKGTWGYGAPINGPDQLSIQTFWASVMVLLGMPESDLPNVINRSKLLFRNKGQFTLEAGYAGAPVNVINASK